MGFQAVLKRKASDAIKAVLKHSRTEDSSPKESRRRQMGKTFIRHNSQAQFKERNQTGVVFDWDDTLFPTYFLEHESGLDCKLSPDQQIHMTGDQLRSAQAKIEECEAVAESLLRCAQNFGRVFIVTLSSRDLLQKRCQAWYPRVWQLLKDSRITFVYAIELHRSILTPSQRKMQMSEFPTSHWAFVKGKAIAKEMDHFYSQYEGQTWKNVISIGDSNFERYGTLGATSAYVQKRFTRSFSTEGEAFVQGWNRFDNDADWSESLEGVHEGHIFKVRAKVMKLKDCPSPADLAQEMNMLLEWFPSICFFDGCLNLYLGAIVSQNPVRTEYSETCSSLSSWSWH